MSYYDDDEDYEEETRDDDEDPTLGELWEEYGPNAYDDDDGNWDTSSRYD